MIQQCCGKLLNQTKQRLAWPSFLPASVMNTGSDNPVCYLRMLRRYPAQMFNQTCHCLTFKRPVMDACKMPNMLVPIHSAQWEIVQSGGGSNGGGLVPFPLPSRQVFHGPLDLVPAKRRSASIALLNFHPSSWMISPVVSRRAVFFFFYFSRHLLSAVSPHLNGVFTKCDWALS